jgi:hypothetical protein
VIDTRKSHRLYGHESDRGIVIEKVCAQPGKAGDADGHDDDEYSAYDRVVKLQDW